jgi:type I restriction enzyme S subunit
MQQYKFDDIAVNSTAKKKPTEADKDTYLGLEHLDSGSLTVMRFGSEVAPIGEKLLMRKGDVLFGKRRAYQKKVAIAPFDGIFSAHGMVLRSKTDVVTEKFFPLFIASDYFLDAAIKISVGSLSPTINWSALKELEFNLPPLNEQDSLAEVLWAMIEAKNAYKRLLSLTDDLVKSQFVEWFGTLENPKADVEVMRIEDVCEKITDGTHQTPTYSDDGYVFLSSKDVKSGCIDWSDIRFISEELHKELSRRVSPKRNDLLLAKNGTTGIAALVDTDEVFDIYVSLALLRPKAGIVPSYLLRAINNDMTKQQFDAGLKGIGVPNLHLGVIKEVKILVAPLALQTRFAAFARAADKSKFVAYAACQAVATAVKMVINLFNKRVNNINREEQNDVQ